MNKEIEKLKKELSNQSKKIDKLSERVETLSFYYLDDLEDARTLDLLLERILKRLSDIERRIRIN